MENLIKLESIIKKFGDVFVDERFVTLQRKDTYEIKEDLKSYGFKFDPKEKEWYFELSENLDFDGVRSLQNGQLSNDLGKFAMIEAKLQKKHGIYIRKGEYKFDSKTI